MIKRHKTVLLRAETEIIEKKSKFISTASPIKDELEALSLIEELRKTHYNASHNVYAYIIGINSEIQRFSDDGEPSGTAGIPVLNVLKNEGLVNVIVVVTRYFGGTLLGAGGLVRAYSKSAKNGIDQANIIEKVPYSVIDVTVNYSLSGKVQYEILNNDFIIENTVYEADVIFTVLVEEGKEEIFSTLMLEITGADVLINRKKTVLCAFVDNEAQKIQKQTQKSSSIILNEKTLKIF